MLARCGGRNEAQRILVRRVAAQIDARNSHAVLEHRADLDRRDETVGDQRATGSAVVVGGGRARGRKLVTCDEPGGDERVEDAR